MDNGREMICPAGKVPCVHYNPEINDQLHVGFCNVFSLGMASYYRPTIHPEETQCRWPEKIQAPEPEPWQDCLDNIWYVHESPNREDKDRKAMFREVLMKNWPKPQKLDVEAIMCDINETIEGCVEKSDLIDALKAGGYDEPTD